MHDEISERRQRSIDRENIACQLAREWNQHDDDIDVGYDEVKVDSVDGGYWVHARLWVSAEDVEERVQP